MSTNTTNYNLVKPALTDAADITATNGNWDTIDSQLKSLSDAAPKKHASTHATGGSDPITPSDIGAVSSSGGTVSGDLDVNGIVSVKSFQQKEGHYNTPVEFGQYIDMHLSGSTADYDGRISLDSNKNLFYNSQEVWLSKSISSGSVNDLTDGVWKVPTGASNKPTDTACVVFHRTWDSNFRTQLAMCADGRRYFRTMSSGTWGSWHIIYDSEHKPYTYGTSDLTAGSSALETGRLYFVYE